MNIETCNSCGLDSIQEERHHCPFKDVTYVGYALINNTWYINCVAEGKGLDIKWRSIPALPIHAISAEKLQGDKDKGSAGKVTGPNIERYIRFRTVVKICLI